ncbi:MAG: response regulator [Synechococcales bacterium]|nr:response regulator [Synechococcales bacterium]
MNCFSKPETGSRKRILLVEDDQANRQMLSDYLVYCGYDVSSISLGSQFFEAIASHQPTLILLDLKLPDISGFTLLEELRQSVQYGDIPVIVISALAFRTDQERAFRLGITHYLVKPIDLFGLQRLLRELTGFSAQ